MLRTDVQYINGQIMAKPTNSADVRMTLPKVQLTDQLATTNWDAAIKSSLADTGHENDPLLNSALTVQKRMAEITQQFVARREKQSPAETQYTHLNRLAEDYSRATKQAADQNDRARNGLKKRIVDIQREFETTLHFDMRDAADIRTVLRESGAEKRQEFISAAIESGDGNLLAVVLNSHPLTVGITADLQKAYRVQTMQKHRPDLLKLEQSLNKVDKLMFDSFTDMMLLEDEITAKSIRQQYEKEIADSKAVGTATF